MGNCFGKVDAGQGGAAPEKKSERSMHVAMEAAQSKVKAMVAPSSDDAAPSKDERMDKLKESVTSAAKIAVEMGREAATAKKDQPVSDEKKAADNEKMSKMKSEAVTAAKIGVEIGREMVSAKMDSGNAKTESNDSVAPANTTTQASHSEVVSNDANPALKSTEPKMEAAVESIPEMARAIEEDRQPIADKAEVNVDSKIENEIQPISEICESKLEVQPYPEMAETTTDKLITENEVPKAEEFGPIKSKIQPPMENVASEIESKMMPIVEKAEPKITDEVKPVIEQAQSMIENKVRPISKMAESKIIEKSLLSIEKAEPSTAWIETKSEPIITLNKAVLSGGAQVKAEPDLQTGEMNEGEASGRKDNASASGIVASSRTEDDRDEDEDEGSVLKSEQSKDGDDVDTKSAMKREANRRKRNRQKLNKQRRSESALSVESTNLEAV